MTQLRKKQLAYKLELIMKNDFPVKIYRFSHFLYTHHLKAISKIIDWTNRLLFSCFIPGSAKIGKNFAVAYWGLGVVIHKDSIIGDNCHIGQNVTLGSNGRGVPQLLDNVRVGGGTFAFGKIIIGNNVEIGANSVVCKNVPDNAVVAGNPFKILRIKDYQE